MEIQLNDYHKKVNAQMQKSMAYWREHPLSLEECLAQFKRLREQRNVCQGSQITRLKDWAKENDCWIEDPESLGVFSDRGSENEVYKRKSIQKDVNCSADLQSVGIVSHLQKYPSPFTRMV